MKRTLLFITILLLSLVANAYSAFIDGIYYNFSGNNATVTYQKYENFQYFSDYSGSVVIPESVTYNDNTYRVTSIGESAFQSCASLTSVTIPNSVTSIGKSAFSYCTSLASVTIPNSVTSIGRAAFFDCRSLTSINIPEGVTSIGDHTFCCCSDLTSINIPEGVTSIGYSAFYGCSSLTSINIPEGVTSIGDEAFYCCYKLASITIPEGVTRIGDETFYYCSSLTSVTIPNSVTSIGDAAFSCDIRLEDVYSYAKNVPITNLHAFNNSPISSATLHVPAASLENYKSTSPWSEFGTIVPLDNIFLLTYIVDGEIYQTYELESGSPITPEPEPTKEGYTFSGWSTIPATMPTHNVTVTGTFTQNMIGTCTAPTISYTNGELKFNSETEGATFHYDIAFEDDNVKSGISNKVQLSVTYHISVYAMKEGYYDSEVVTGTLCWIDQQPSTEGIVAEDAVTEVKAVPVLIQSNGGTITVQGANEGTEIIVYNVDGMKQGTVVSGNGFATIQTSLQSGSVALVKIGEKTVKLLLK